MLDKIKLKWNNLVKREIRELAGPISKEGLDGTITGVGYQGHVRADEFQGQRPVEFCPSTIIINGGNGEWNLDIPEYIRNNLIDMTLKIETIRTHGMLHSPQKNKSASIFVNGNLVDKINLVKQHPHGTDFGVDSRRPYPVFRYINRENCTQNIRIEVDKDALWDIDRISLEPVILRKEWKPVSTMILGAIISAAMGGLISIVIYYLTKFNII
jgi:hypothetical protein